MSLESSRSVAERMWTLGNEIKCCRVLKGHQAERGEAGKLGPGPLTLTPLTWHQQKQDPEAENTPHCACRTGLDRGSSAQGLESLERQGVDKRA